MEFMHWDKPLQSVYIEFVRRQAAQILDLGEFEAFRQWLLSGPDCFTVPVEPNTVHLVARQFFKALRAEKKRAQEQR
jgi:hypothetical protein